MRSGGMARENLVEGLSTAKSRGAYGAARLPVTRSRRPTSDGIIDRRILLAGVPRPFLSPRQEGAAIEAIDRMPPRQSRDSSRLAYHCCMLMRERNPS